MKKTVLVIEDEVNIRKFISVNLTARGYRVVEAESAEQALELLREVMPAVALLDIRLPGMDGWALLNAISNDPQMPDLPVVIVTGSIVHSALEDINYSNLVGVLAKPVQVTHLLQSVQKAIGPSNGHSQSCY
ncbi:MAG: response regulator [Aggregatilineales bacterium]|jgi:CheY-like chemotaxis protein|nr:response regulator [Chloroflexota bacterium]HOA25192.1 response regulator [Aggregatilineales bacterium]HPV07278.1 response regulator [Aggregatilineales bacterium]